MLDLPSERTMNESVSSTSFYSSDESSETIADQNSVMKEKQLWKIKIIWKFNIPNGSYFGDGGRFWQSKEVRYGNVLHDLMQEQKIVQK